MAAMKVTTSAAMRARDVSRPRAEHLAGAEAAEASAAPSAVVSRPAPAAAPADAGVPVHAAPGDEVLPAARVDDRPGGGRRWRSRGAGRGRASR